MAFSLTWLPEILEDAGLKVAEQPGWRTRGRGEIDIVKGAMCHHTSGSAHGIMPSLGVITNGRPDLAGPLAQLGLGRDGTFLWSPPVVQSRWSWHVAGPQRGKLELHGEAECQ